MPAAKKQLKPKEELKQEVAALLKRRYDFDWMIIEYLLDQFTSFDLVQMDFNLAREIKDGKGIQSRNS